MRRTEWVALPEGPIFLLTHLRYLGYNFNPVSFFYCYDREDCVHMIMAEVNNTFGETANYWLTPTSSARPAATRDIAFRRHFMCRPFLKLGHRIRLDFHSARRPVDHSKRQL